MKASVVLKRLKSLKNQKNIEGMARFGINSYKTLGISVVVLRKIAKEIGKDHNLALELWKSGFHEAKILAAFIDVPEKVTQKQMEEWVKEFDSWDVCDQVCSNLFDKTPFAYKKAKEWATRTKEFEKRAGFVLMAALAVHDKKESDSTFIGFFPLLKKHSVDERNYVKKAINWAIRQIGKRNEFLKRQAIILSEEIKKINSRSARWIATDAIRELSTHV